MTDQTIPTCIIDTNETPKRVLQESDIVDMQTYGAQRKELRKFMVHYKNNRRMNLGPYCTLLFENFHTMRYQVHEMLYTEGNGPGQLEDELTAYNPLIPCGNTLSFTMMLDIGNPEKRKEVLSHLGGIEDTVYLRFANHNIKASYEQEVERTSSDGKTSSVHFLHFTCTPEQAKDFTNSNGKATIAIEHPRYSHTAIIPPEVHAAIHTDL